MASQEELSKHWTYHVYSKFPIGKGHACSWHPIPLAGNMQGLQASPHYLVLGYYKGVWFSLNIFLAMTTGAELDPLPFPFIFPSGGDGTQGLRTLPLRYTPVSFPFSLFQISLSSVSAVLSLSVSVCLSLVQGLNLGTSVQPLSHGLLLLKVSEAELPGRPCWP